MKNLTKTVILAILGAFVQMHGAASSSSASSSEGDVTPTFGMVNLSDCVKHQQGADCGYHSVKNAVAMYRYYTDEIDQTVLAEQLKSEPKAGLASMAHCRKAITGSPRAAFIDDEQVYRVADLMNFPQEKLTVLANISNQHLTKDEALKLGNMAESLMRGQPVVHAFVLGDMQEYESRSGQTTGTSGHYIAAVLVKKKLAGPILISVANSMGESPLDTQLAQQLMHFIKRLNHFELIFREIEQLVEVAEHNLNVGAELAALEKIEEALASTQRHNLYNSYFIKNYLHRINNTLDTLESFLDEAGLARLVRAREALHSPEQLAQYKPPIRVDLPSTPPISSGSIAASSSSSSSSASSSSSSEGGATPDKVSIWTTLSRYFMTYFTEASI